MKKHFFLLFSILLVAFSGKAQFYAKNKKSTDLCVFLGGSYYIGDLNQTKQFLFTKPAAGIALRYNQSPRIAYRASIMVGSVEAHDSYSSDEAQKQRNLSFKSQINEISVQMEFNFNNYRIGIDKERFSPYIFWGIGVFSFNPKGQLKNGNYWVSLQPLRTEGEGMEGGSKNKPYKLVQVSIPFGIGFKANLTRKIGIGIEWGMRKTFTDYLDDVSGKYYNPALLSGENAAYLSDPSKGTDPNYTNVGKQRGNSTNKDWYSFAGIVLSFKLTSTKEKCPTVD